MNAGEFVVMFVSLMLVVTVTVVVQKRRGTYHRFGMIGRALAKRRRRRDNP